MNKRSLMVGLSSLLGLSLCSGVFAINQNTSSLEVKATEGKRGDYYKKVTTTSEVTDGNYLIIYEAGKVAFDGSLAKLDVVKNTIAISFNDSSCIDWSESLEKSSFTYDSASKTIRSASGYYIGKTANSNGMDSSKTTKYTNAISITNGIATIKTTAGPSLKYNNSSDQVRFRYFKSGQSDISIYKLTSVTVEPIYATGITIASNLGDKTLYDTSGEVKITPTIDPNDYNGDIAYEFSDSNMEEYASIKKNDDLTCSLTPKKTGKVSIIAKASSSEAEAISSNVLTFEIVEDTPTSIELSGQNTSFKAGDAFSYGSNVKATIIYKSGAVKQIDTSLLTAKLDGKEINESTTLTTEDNGKEVTISYEGVSTSYTIMVLGKATYSYKYVGKMSEGANQLGTQKWILGDTSSDYFGFTSDKGAQIGSKKSPAKEIRISSEPFIGEANETQVKTIAINSSVAEGGKAALEVLVNGKQVGDKVNLTSTATTYIFALENESNGIVEIKITNSASTAVYIKSIEINAEKDDGTNVILNSIAKDISSIKTCSIEEGSQDFENFLATSTELGTYEEVIESYQNELSSLMILDYSYEDYSSNKKSYTNIDRSIYVSAMEKYNALEARYLSSTKAANGISASASNNSIAIAATASLIGILAFSLLMISKKKKA